MPPPKLPLEILLTIGRLLINNKGALRFADFNSFLQVNRALCACLNHTLWREAALEVSSITERLVTHLIRTNDLARLGFFPELGADTETLLPNIISDWDADNTPLRVVSQQDNIPMARLLLEYGAHLVQYNRLGHPSYSAIHAARSAEMVQLLLDHHADPEQRFASGGEPLLCYAERGNIEAMRAVLRNGAAVYHGGNISASTPLHYAVRRNIEVVKLLLEYGADVKLKDCISSTVLHSAAEAGEDGCGEASAGTLWPEATREKDIYENTPLHLAADTGKTDTVRLLLGFWPEGIRGKNEYDNTPLHLAAQRWGPMC
jgi:ankyrin repeat protein